MPKESAVSDLLNVLNSSTFVAEKRTQIKIDKKLSKHGIEPGTLNEILVSNDKINELNEEELCLLAVAVSDAISDENIYDYKKYFTVSEINKSKKYKRERNELTLPYTFHNVLQSSDQDYLTILSAKDIAALYNSGILTYNYESQRLPKRKILKNGQVKVEPTLNKKSVAEITQLMRDRKYRSNTIVFNILMDGTEQIDYDEGDLTVISGQINIIDGFHRLQSILNILEEDPTYDGYMDVAIKYLDIEEARFYLGQINKMNKFDKTLVKSLMNLELSDKIVDRIEKNSSLKGRISTNTTLIKKFGYLTNFAILSDAIKKIFEPQTNKDVIDYSKFLSDFFSYLIDSFKDEFSSDIKTLNSIKNSSWINHHNTFVLYIVLAKKIYDKYGKDYDPEIIIRAVKEIDFRRQEGLPYHEVISPQGKVNSNEIKRRIKQFAEDNINI